MIALLTGGITSLCAAVAGLAKGGAKKGAGEGGRHPDLQCYNGTGSGWLEEDPGKVAG